MHHCQPCRSPCTQSLICLRLLQFMSSQSGFHTTEDDTEEPAEARNAAPMMEQPNGDSALRTQLHDLAVSSQGEIAYWKAQVDQSKQDMVEILGHAENLSQACEELEDEVADLKADNARLKSLAESSADLSPSKVNQHVTIGGVRSRLAVALDGEGGDPSFQDLLAKGGVAQQLSAVAQRLRGEQQRTEKGTADNENDDASQYVAEQLGLLGVLLEGAAREMLEQATELATEKEAHDVTASRLALLQKKYAVEEMKNSARGVVSTGTARSPIGTGSPGTPRSQSRPSRRPRSAHRQKPLSPNGSNWDETLRESIPADTDTSAVTIDHSRRNSISTARRTNTSNGRHRPTGYTSAASYPVRRREQTDQRSISRPRAGSPPPRHSTAEFAHGNKSSRSISASRKRHGSRSSGIGPGTTTAALGYRRTTAASLSHEPASVSATLP
eukprot:COSAG02_NODE_572_length_20163_cov_9.875461_12_plen_442_part_00